MLKIVFIRHAESAVNALEVPIVGGQSNEAPITEKGQKQAVLLGERLAKEAYHFDQIVSSSAVRTQQTAKIALEKANIDASNIVLSDALLELSQGDWEGCLRTEIYTPEVINQINVDNWNFKAPNGESQRDVETRVVDWILKHILDPYKGEDKTIAIFGHGIAIKCFLRWMLGYEARMTHKIWIENTSLTICKYNKEKGWFLEGMNDYSHLK